MLKLPQAELTSPPRPLEGAYTQLWASANYSWVVVVATAETDCDIVTSGQISYEAATSNTVVQSFRFKQV